MTDDSTRFLELALERRIAQSYNEMITASTPERRRCAAKRMARLISMRSHEQVARMERERGLIEEAN